MRTIIIILSGFALLGGCIAIARLIGTNAAASMSASINVFIAIWFVVAAVNMWIGVSRAGYSFTEELPIFLLIFLLPAAAAIFIKWKFL